MKGEKYAVGIDLGGTFVKYALMEEAGKVIVHGKVPIGASLVFRNRS